MGSRPRLLVVEDSPDLAWLLVEVTTELGFESTAALTCAEALARIEAEPPFEVVLTDLGLDGNRTDGFAVATAVAAKAGHARTCLLLLTGSPIEPGDPRLANVTQLLQKPLDLSALEEALRSFLSA